MKLVSRRNYLKFVQTYSVCNETHFFNYNLGSDLSDLDMHNSKGVATFVNKIIPGREDLNKAVASSSTNNLSKNSIGYELLERKKSLDESNSNDR